MKKTETPINSPGRHEGQVEDPGELGAAPAGGKLCRSRDEGDLQSAAVLPAKVPDLCEAGDAAGVHADAPDDEDGPRAAAEAREQVPRRGEELAGKLVHSTVGGLGNQQWRNGS